MDKIFFAWYKSQSHCFKMNLVFTHDNTPSVVSKLTSEMFELKKFTVEKIIDRWLSSPDQNQ